MVNNYSYATKKAKVNLYYCVTLNYTPGNEREEQPLPPVQEYILLPDYMLAHEYPSEDTLNKEPGWRRFSL